MASASEGFVPLPETLPQDFTGVKVIDTRHGTVPPQIFCDWIAAGCTHQCGPGTSSVTDRAVLTVDTDPQSRSGGTRSYTLGIIAAIERRWHRRYRWWHGRDKIHSEPETKLTSAINPRKTRVHLLPILSIAQNKKNDYVLWAQIKKNRHGGLPCIVSNSI